MRRLLACISNPFLDCLPLGLREPCGYGLSPRLALYGLGAASFMIVILFCHSLVIVCYKWVGVFRAAIRPCCFPRGRVAVSGVVFVDENINLPALKNASINGSFHAQFPTFV